MRLGVISDTHGHTHNTLQAVRMFESLSVDAVLHCGDIGSVEIPRLFPSWPTHFVLGNVDHPPEALIGAIAAAGQTCHDRFGCLELEGLRIALLHGDDTRRWKEAVESGDWDLVCYGHTHRADCRREGTTLVLNPGAVYRANPHSVAVVSLPSLEVDFVRF